MTTIHGFSSPRIVPVYAKYDGRTTYVAISDADRHPALDYAATIHHGIDTDAFALHPEPGGYLAYFGRIHPDKGAVAAIDTAERGRAAAADGRDHPGRATTSTTQVAPRIDGDRVRYVGPVDAEDRSALPRRRPGAAAPHRLRRAVRLQRGGGDGLRHAGRSPSTGARWPSSSTTGVTGMLVADVDGAVAAVDEVSTLDRAAIRAVAVERFGVDRMVDQYVAVYEQAIADARRR